MRFSPGIAQGCAELLSLARKHSQEPEGLLNAFDSLGAIPTTKLLAIAQTLDWVGINEHGHLTPTPSGERLLGIDGYAPLLRQMLLDYIDIERPNWIQNASSGRARVMAFAGPEIAQVLVEANLASGTDDVTVAFWDTLAARARGQKDSTLNDIGRKGERLSLAYEAQRTKRAAKWISIESNEDGYDILSVVDADNLSKLSIEVKTSTIGLGGSFYLSTNEWERAKETSYHLFHLWDISKTPPRLGIISVESMREHVPANKGTGEWQSVKVPLIAFETEFFSM
jgi:hypothetical protein